MMSEIKNDDDVSVKLYTRLKKEAPLFIKNLENKSNEKIYDPLASYDFFTEKVKNIPNIIHGEKKTHFCYCINE